MLPVGRSVGGPGARGGAHFGKAAAATPGRPYFPQFEAELGEIRVGECSAPDSPAAWLPVVHVTPDTDSAGRPARQCHSGPQRQILAAQPIERPASEGPGPEARGGSLKSDLRSHCAIVQPRLYDSAVVTQITLKTEGPHGLPSDRLPAEADPLPLCRVTGEVMFHLNRLRLRSRFTLERTEPCANAATRERVQQLTLRH